MTQPNESASGDLSNVRCRQKWDSIFDGSDLYFDEELDYEYSDAEDDANCFPLRCTWSPTSAFSSRSSSRATSPIGRVINLIDDEKEYAERTTRVLKKLRRDYSKLCGIKRESFTPDLRKDWKKTKDFKGMLQRWRIRSLDGIFTYSNPLHVPECSGNLQFPSKKQNMRKPLHHMQATNAAVDTVSNLSIVVNNDLCTTAVPELPPSKFPTESGEQAVPIAGNQPSDCDTKSNFSMITPQGLDMPLLNVPSTSQIVGPNKQTQFLNNKGMDELFCDTYVRTVLQQPSQQQTYHPAHPGSAISFNHFSRYEPYNRPASVGSQRIFRNIEEGNESKLKNFATARVIPNVLPPANSPTTCPSDDVDDLQNNVPYKRFL